jgi:hypothetical protein
MDRGDTNVCAFSYPPTARIQELAQRDPFVRREVVAWEDEILSDPRFLALIAAELRAKQRITAQRHLHRPVGLRSPLRLGSSF